MFFKLETFTLITLKTNIKDPQFTQCMTVDIELFLQNNQMKIRCSKCLISK